MTNTFYIQDVHYDYLSLTTYMQSIFVYNYIYRKHNVQSIFFCLKRFSFGRKYFVFTF